MYTAWVLNKSTIEKKSNITFVVHLDVVDIPTWRSSPSSVSSAVASPTTSTTSTTSTSQRTSSQVKRNQTYPSMYHTTIGPRSLTQITQFKCASPVAERSAEATRTSRAHRPRKGRVSSLSSKSTRVVKITRAFVRKMVNVGSQLPFNLHNQVIPEPEAHDSISRSPSRSDVSGYYYDSNKTDYRYQNHHNGRRHGRGFTLRSRSASPSYTPSAVITDQPKPNPILNVRWVGFTPKEVKNRGRQRERKSSQSGTPKSEEGEEDATSSSVRRLLSCLTLGC